MAELAKNVYVQHPSGKGMKFGPGDELPDWARAQITNPKVWDDYEGDADPEPVEKRAIPPKTGKGSSRQEWAAYLRSVEPGAQVEDSDTKDDLIKYLEAHGHPTG
jgi:hypothetical protein